MTGGNQAWNIEKIADAKNFRTGYASSQIWSLKEWLSERNPFMKLRTFFLAAIALVVLAGSVVPANAAGHHHRRHHRHHPHR